MNPKEKLNNIFEFLKDQIEPGVEYYSYLIRSSNARSLSGQSFYKVTDGKMNFDKPECLNRRNREALNQQVYKTMDDIAYDSEPGVVVFFKLCRELGFTVEVADAKLLTSMIKLELISDLDSGRRKEIFVKIIPSKEANEIELDSWQKIYYPDGEIKEFTGAPINPFIPPLYKAVNEKLQAVHIFASENDVDIQTTPEIQGLTAAYTLVEDLSFDASSIENIYAFLESSSEAKIAIAMESLNANLDFKAKAEKRYLQFIRARVGANAGLESFAEAMLGRKERDLFSRNFVENVISLSYLSQKECQTVVDFIGSLVMSHLDIHAFKKQMEATEEISDLFNVYYAAAEKVRMGILEEAKNHPDGWFSTLITMLANHKVEKVMFEKTHFIIENNDVLKAFIFYIDLNHGRELYFDVFQSYVPELTEFFWFLPNLPKTSWGDTALALPECSLKFRRKAYYRLGDGEEWLRKSPKPNN